MKVVVDFVEDLAIFYRFLKGMLLLSMYKHMKCLSQRQIALIFLALKWSNFLILSALKLH
jgi:hypothetical protein